MRSIGDESHDHESHRSGILFCVSCFDQLLCWAFGFLSILVVSAPNAILAVTFLKFWISTEFLFPPPPSLLVSRPILPSFTDPLFVLLAFNFALVGLQASCPQVRFG